MGQKCFKFQVLGLEVGLTLLVRTNLLAKMKQNFLPRKTSGRNLKITPKWNGRVESKTQTSIKFGWKKSRHFRVGNGGSLDVKCIRDESSIFSRGHSQPCWRMDANNPSSANPKRCNLGPSTASVKDPLRRRACHVIMLGKKSSYPPVNQQLKAILYNTTYLEDN